MSSEAVISEQALRWKCRRGMLELDLLLNRFVDNKFNDLDKRQLDTLIRLLDYPDQTLHDLLVSGVASSDDDITVLVESIVSNSKACA